MTLNRIRPQGWGRHQTWRHSEIGQLDQFIAERMIDKIGGDSVSGTISVADGASILSQNAHEVVIESGASVNLSHGRISQDGYLSLQANAGSLVITGSLTASGAATIGTLSLGTAPSYNSPITVTRSVPFMPSFIAAGSAMLNTGALSFHNTSNSYCIVPLDMPEAMKIINIGVYFKGAGHSSLPDNMPSFTVYAVSGLSGVTAALGTATDTSGSTVVYDAAHQVLLTLSDQPVVSRSRNRYFVRILSEYGTNSIDGGLQVYAVKYSGIISAHDSIRFT